MTTGLVKMGAPGNLKPYIVEDYRLRAKIITTLMSSKLGTGAGDYNDLEDWSYWVTEFLRRGVGRVDPMDGGFWYSTVDTRFQKQTILSPLLVLTGRTSTADSDANFSSVSDIDDPQTIGGTGNPTKVAIPFQADGSVSSVWVYMLTGHGQPSATVTIMSGATPTTTITSGSAASNDLGIGWAWRKASVSFTAASGTQYWAVVEPPSGSEIDVAISTVPSGAGPAYAYDGSWAEFQTPGGVSLYGFAAADAPVMGEVTASADFNGTMYVGDSNGDIWKWDSGNDLWAQVGTTLAAGVTDMATWFGDLYVGIGDSNNARKVTVLDAVSDAGFAASFFVVAQGYLWRSVGHEAYYNTAEDLSTWGPAITVGPDDYSITGLSFLGENIIVATEQALWSIGFGDWVRGVTLWGYYDSSNGANMLNHQGYLYWSQGNSVQRFIENAPILDIWNREDRLPSELQGTVGGIVGTNRELMVLIDPNEATGLPSVWMFNNEGWHHMATLPQGSGGSHIAYDPYRQSVWVFDKAGFAWRFLAPVDTSTPLEDPDARFQPDGWLDTGTYYGGLIEIEKDWDAVTVIGENITSATPVDIYYRTPVEDEESITTEDGDELETEGTIELTIRRTAWYLLGTATQNRQRIRWSDYATRPASDGLRIAFRLRTTDVDNTPVVRAVIVRYHPMITDRWRWSLPIVVANYAQMYDYVRDTRTYAEVKADLEALILNRTPPFIFEDVDGTQYEVKTANARERLTKLEYFSGAFNDIAMTYMIDVVQVVAEEYNG